MPDQDLRKLPPQERLKKLKELEQKKKKEIEEAQQQIRESESEITEQKKWTDKVPIPEVAKEELEGLSDEGKQLLKTHKGTKDTKKSEAAQAPKEEDAGKKTRESSKLEETVLQERVSLTPEVWQQMEYGAKAREHIAADYKPLSQQSTMDLYQEIGTMKQAIEAKGYVSRADERKAEYLSGIVEERLQASKEGTYTFSEETARAASVTRMLAHTIKEAYKKGSIFEHDWYKGR